MIVDRRNHINQAGARGEALVSAILPKAKHVDGRGYDFVLPNQKRVEVKAHYGNSGRINFKLKSKFPLKAGTGVWQNTAAHHLIIVTKTHLLLIDARQFRDFISSNQHTVLDPGTPKVVSYSLNELSSQPWTVGYPREALKDKAERARILNDYFGTEVA